MPRPPSSARSSGTALPSRWLRDSLRSASVSPAMKPRHAVARGLLERAREVALDLFEGGARLQPAGDLDAPVRRLVEPVFRCGLADDGCEAA